MSPDELMKAVARAMDGRKAEGIVALEITGLTTIADYFVICTARSNTQMKAIADAVEKSAEEAGEKVLHVEGYQSASWILIDLGSVVAHVFYQDTREFYGLERLWNDAKRIDVESAL